MNPPRFLTSGATRALHVLVLALFLSASFVLSGCDDDDDDGGMGTTPDPTIAELAAETSDLSTLVAALQAAGLDDNLQQDGPFTVFAPTNAAFESVDTEALTSDADLLTKILQYHVIAGQEISADQIEDGQTVETLQGESLEFSVENGTVRVNGATVQTPNLQASNGIVHTIDGVLLREINAVERATISPSFSILADLVGAAGLADALSGPGPDGEDGLTVFAPTNDAFLAALDNNDNGQIDDDEIPSSAAEILQYHVLDDVFLATDVPTSETNLPTLEGSELTVVRSGSDVAINPGAENASVVAPDVAVENGVIHGIDTVLQRPGGGSAADVTITIDNIGASAWEVTGVDGADGVAPIGEQNPTLTLTAGTRYRVVNNGGSAHPFGLQNSADTYLLRQNGQGSLEGDASVNYQEDEAGVTFTFSPTLSDAVVSYRCTIHASMEGSVQTAP